MFNLIDDDGLVLTNPFFCSSLRVVNLQPAVVILRCLE